METLPEPLRRFVPFFGVAVLLVVGYLAYGKLAGGGSHEAEAEAGTAPTALDLEAAADDKESRREDEAAGPIVDLGAPLVVNLGDPGLRATVRLAVTIQVDEGTPVVPGKDGAAPRLAEEALARHVLIATLGGLTSANLLAPEAREAVRKLVVRRLNRSLPATLVLAAYFTELTVEGASPAAEPADVQAAAKAGKDAEEAEESEDAEADEEDSETAEESEHGDEAEADEGGEAEHAEETSEGDDAAEHTTDAKSDAHAEEPAKSAKEAAHEEAGK